MLYCHVEIYKVPPTTYSGTAILTKQNQIQKGSAAMRILLAEDDKNLNRTLSKQLQGKGFLVDSCFDGDEALYYACQNIHDVILLDRMLPYMEGTEIVTNLRKNQVNTPIILITALGTLNDKVTGLNLGADDYLVKPFEFEELLARIQCVTRRPPIIHMAKELNLMDISYDEDSNMLIGPDGSCSLSNREGALLKVFLQNAEQTLSRNTLLLKIWGLDSNVEEGNLDNYIYFLRRRLKNVGSQLELKTVRGIGYGMHCKKS